MILRCHLSGFLNCYSYPVIKETFSDFHHPNSKLQLLLAIYRLLRLIPRLGDVVELIFSTILPHGAHHGVSDRGGSLVLEHVA